MAKTIVGLFDSKQTAHQIDEGLKDRGISKRHRGLLNWRDVSEGKDPWGIGKKGQDDQKMTDKLIDELESRGVPSDDARDFAEAVRRGGNLVVTEVDDDQEASEVERFMDQHRDRSAEALGLESSRARREGGVDEGRRAEQEGHIQSAREDVKIGKRDVETGGVRVEKRVEERPVEEDVRLREEHVDIDREAVDKPTTDEDVFREESFEVTEHAEEPVVEKETRIEEEIHIGKDVEEHTETIHETARETVIDIEELTADVPEEHAYTAHAPTYREHYDESFGEGGDAYSNYEPAYRYGHAFGVNDQYRERDFGEVESDMKRSYEEEHGKGTFERYKDAARYGFESAKRRLRR
jgi:stress response protein YsnF